MFEKFLENKQLAAGLFCLVGAFVLYELSGIIGKEMLADKHISGKGEGYQNITFGKEHKRSLIVNVQYNIFAPLIYMLLIAALLKRLEMTWLYERAVYMVPCYYLVRCFMINIVSGKRQLYNFGYELRNGIIGTALAFLVQHILILSGKPILPTIEEFRTQMWLVLIALAYQFFVRVYGKSPSLRQDRVCTKQMKQKYILDKYDKFHGKYHGIVKDIMPGNYLQTAAYAIMIYENYNRTWTQRLGENILFFFGKRPMTLGIMQVRTIKFIRNAESIELGCQKIKESYEAYLAEALERNDGNYCFAAGEPELCLDKICADYNGAEDYTEAIKYIFYTLHSPVEEFEESYHIYENNTEDNSTEQMTDEAGSLYELVHMVESSQHVTLRGVSELLGEIRLEGLENVVIEGDDAIILAGTGGSLIFRNCCHITLRNLSFQNIEGDGEEAERFLYFENCQDIRLELSKFEGVKRPNVVLLNSTEISFAAVNFKNSGEETVVFDEAEAELSHITFSNSTAKENIITMNSSVVKLSDVIVTGGGAVKYFIGKENSKMTCHNVFVLGKAYEVFSRNKKHQN